MFHVPPPFPLNQERSEEKQDLRLLEPEEKPVSAARLPSHPNHPP